MEKKKHISSSSMVSSIAATSQPKSLALIRSMSNTPLQVDVTFLMVKSHVSLNTSANHLNRFYSTFEEIKNKKFDGMIITGAPVEHLEFEEVESDRGPRATKVTKIEG